MSTITFTTLPQENGKGDLEIQTRYEFGPNYRVEITTQVPSDFAHGKSLVMAQSDLWKVVADDALTLSNSLRQQAQAG